MNARKVLLVLGGCIVALVAAIIAFSLFTLHKVVGEKNRAKTEKARQSRWAREQETQASNLTVTPDGVVEPKPDENATDEGEATDEKKD